jgi:hypothetical protein
MTRRRWNPAQGVAAFMRLTAPNETLSPEQTRRYLLDAHAALLRFELGQADRAAFDDLAICINWALLLAEGGYGADQQPQIKDAQAALVRADARIALGCRRWGFDGPGLTAIKEALRTFEAQIEAATTRDLLAALTEIRRRMDAGIVYELAC